MTTAPERPARDFDSVEDILATLRAAGHRVSAPAAHVLDALFAADEPVSADHIAGTDTGLERCGRVTTVDPATLDGVRAALATDFGHHARFSHFPIHGLCASCAEAGGAARHEH